MSIAEAGRTRQRRSGRVGPAEFQVMSLDRFDAVQLECVMEWREWVSKLVDVFGPSFEVVECTLRCGWPDRPTLTFVMKYCGPVGPLFLGVT